MLYVEDEMHTIIYIFFYYSSSQGRFVNVVGVGHAVLVS
jgi:hypothetical protein